MRMLLVPVDFACRTLSTYTYDHHTRPRFQRVTDSPPPFCLVFNEPTNDLIAVEDQPSGPAWPKVRQAPLHAPLSDRPNGATDDRGHFADRYRVTQSIGRPARGRGVTARAMTRAVLPVGFWQKVQQIRVFAASHETRHALFFWPVLTPLVSIGHLRAPFSLWSAG